MANPPDNRVMLTVRIKPAALTAIERCAERDARTRADEIRMLLAYAVTTMPKGWLPT